MSRIDKNQAVIDYLITCTDIYNNPLYFNLINAKDNSIQVMTTSQDKVLNTTNIDGSVDKKFTFNIVIFKSISDAEIVKPTGTDAPEYPTENIEELDAVQKIIDWIEEQNDLYNYPDFGENCYIDKIDTTTEEPRFEGIDYEINPPLAMYSVSIEINYLDTSKVIFK